MEEGEKPKVVIAPKRASVDTLREMVAEEKKREERARVGGLTERERELLDRSAESQREEQRAFVESLLEPIKRQQEDFGRFLEEYMRQQEGLRETLWRLPPEAERRRWVDVERDQEFYTRFQATMEPRYYQQMETEERKLWDGRWQLARAAFFKKIQAAFPEKLIENQDLQQLKIEQMERLYEMPGVKEGLEWYAHEVVFGSQKVVVDRDGKQIEISILECKDEIEFEEFRKKMQEFAKSAKGIKGKKKEEQDQLVLEADAVAWNWIWCSNLIESLDSRYSYIGGKDKGDRERHKNLPGTMVSDDLRAVFHPQEKFEDKCEGDQEWGAFGRWGKTQMAQTRKRLSVTARDEIEFRPSLTPTTWSAERNTRRVTRKGGNVIEVAIPECYPTTSMRSFWEETTTQRDVMTKEGIKTVAKPLIEYLLEGKKIPWGEVGSDPWIGHLPIRLVRTVRLLENFKPGKPLIIDKTDDWVGPILDIFVRLNLEGNLERQARRGVSKQTFHNLKVWLVAAGYGGVIDPRRRIFDFPLTGNHKRIVRNVLRSPQYQYLSSGEELKVS